MSYAYVINEVYSNRITLNVSDFMKQKKEILGKYLRY